MEKADKLFLFSISRAIELVTDFIVGKEDKAIRGSNDVAINKSEQQ